MGNTIRNIVMTAIGRYWYQTVNSISIFDRLMAPLIYISPDKVNEFVLWLNSRIVVIVVSVLSAYIALYCSTARNIKSEHRWQGFLVCSWVCFTNVSRSFQNIISKFMYCRNLISCENFKLTFCTCTQSHALCTCTQSVSLKFSP